MRSIGHDQAMADLFREDPVLAVDVINSILGDGEQAELRVTLRQMVLAAGGAEIVAPRAQLTPIQLETILSCADQLGWTEFVAILKALGLRLIARTDSD